MTLIDLRGRALEIAIGELGTRETAPNRGPRVERYQRAAGLSPGSPWCCAFLVFVYDEAGRDLNIESPLPRTGKVARLWRKSPALWKSGEPTVGAIYCHLSRPEDPESPGHCGIVIRPTSLGFVGVEGNTDDLGGREGDGVRVKSRDLAYANLGFLDVGRLGPEPEPLVA